MGSGTICDAQYLFSEDILGYNNDHIPRHAKTYGNLKKNYDEIKTKSIQSYKLFIKDVRNMKYPNKKQHIKIEKKELKKFKDYLDQ
jgi:3-methyl-2-oxobutanoate hydroxymethyltransferase